MSLWLIDGNVAVEISALMVYPKVGGVWIKETLGDNEWRSLEYENPSAEKAQSIYRGFKDALMFGKTFYEIPKE